MPEPLQYRRVEPAPALVQALVLLVVSVPPIALFLMWWRGGRLHFEDVTANLVAHVLALLVPVAWAGTLLAQPIRFRPTAERVVGPTSFFAAIDGSWWMSALMWPAPILGLALLVERSIEALSRAGLVLSSSSPDLLLLWVTTFVLVLLWGTSFRERSAVRLSDEGVRTANLHYIEWPRLDHVVQRGSRFDLYHEVNPAIPFSCIRLKDPEARVVFLEFLARHGVRRATRSSLAYWALRVLVAVGLLAQIAGGLVLQSGIAGNRLWAVVLVFLVGLGATLLLERYRGIARITKLKPFLEPEEQVEPTPGAGTGGESEGRGPESSGDPCRRPEA